jgi:hypothetical protein
MLAQPYTASLPPNTTSVMALLGTVKKVGVNVDVVFASSVVKNNRAALTEPLATRSIHSNGTSST